MKLAQLIDAIPVVQSTAQRDALYAAPDDDQRAWNKETHTIQRYDASLAGWQDEVYQSPAQAVGWFNVKDKAYGGGAKGDNVADDHAAIQATVTAAPNGSVIYFPKGNYKNSGLIQVNARGIRFEGVGFDQCGINYTGAGTCIQLGTDSGNPYDTSEYNGTCQGFSFVGMSLACTNLTTPLLNTLANYGAGAYGIRDWRSGEVLIERSSLQGWDFAFWGIQSDINRFVDLIVIGNHTGIYLGPRSDQARGDHIWSIHNDTSIFFEGSTGHRVSHWVSDTDGSATTCPIKVRNAVYSTTRRAGGITFVSPWCESLSSGSAAYDVEAFFDLGTGDAQQNGTFTIRDAFVAVQLYSTPAVQHTLYLVKVDNVRAVVIDGLYGTPNQIPWNNLRAVVKVANGAAAVTTVWFRDYEIVASRFIENFSATPVFCHLDVDTNGSYTVNTVGGTGAVHLGMTGFQRRMLHSNAAPVAGTYVGGDMVFNRLFQAGTASIWAWLAQGGSPGPFYPLVWPTMSGDRGDANITLTVGADHVNQRFATALTANRTVTLSGTGAGNGARFRVTRTGLGAFTLDVGGLKTIPVGTAAFVDVMYDGAAWRLEAYGTL